MLQLMPCFNALLVKADGASAAAYKHDNLEFVSKPNVFMLLQSITHQPMTAMLLFLPITSSTRKLTEIKLHLTAILKKWWKKNFLFKVRHNLVSYARKWYNSLVCSFLFCLVVFTYYIGEHMSLRQDICPHVSLSSIYSWVIHVDRRH